MIKKNSLYLGICAYISSILSFYLERYYPPSRELLFILIASSMVWCFFVISTILVSRKNNIKFMHYGWVLLSAILMIGTFEVLLMISIWKIKGFVP